MFHRWVEGQLSEIKEEDLIEPRHEHEIDPEREHYLGDMSEDLRKLYTLWKKTNRENRLTAQKVAEASVGLVLGLPEKLEKADLERVMKKIRTMRRELLVAEEKESALRQAFWVSVRGAFPAADGNALGVRKGFKVVWLEGEAEVRIPPEMAGILLI